MTPRTISFPPGRGKGFPKGAAVKPIKCCLQYNVDVLEIDFNDDGNFTISKPSAFKESPQSAHHMKNDKITGLHPAQRNDSVVVKYYDEHDKQTYEYDITIQDTACTNPCNS